MTSLFDSKEIVKIFRFPSETTLQHSIFDRKRQTYLLKVVNRCSDNLSNSEDVRWHARQSVCKNHFTLHTVINVNWEGDVHISSWNGASVADKFSYFSRNVQNKHKNSERNSVIGFINLKSNNAEIYNRLSTWVTSNTDMTSLTCAGSAMVGIFNKG